MQCERVDTLAATDCAPLDVMLALGVTRAQLRHPLGARGTAREQRRETAEEFSGIACDEQIGSAVHARFAPAAVRRDQSGVGTHVSAVVQPEVARHAGEDHAIGLTQRLTALMTQLQGMLAPEETAPHP